MSSRNPPPHPSPATSRGPGPAQALPGWPHAQERRRRVCCRLPTATARRPLSAPCPSTRAHRPVSRDAWAPRAAAPHAPPSAPHWPAPAPYRLRRRDTAGNERRSFQPPRLQSTRFKPPVPGRPPPVPAQFRPAPQPGHCLLFPAVSQARRENSPPIPAMRPNAGRPPTAPASSWRS